MASIDRFMSWLERRLQEIVEGGAAWLLPGGHRRRELAGWLIEVMNDGVRCCKDGSLQAPDLFTLTLPGPAAIQLDDSLLLELATALQQEARRRGLTLLSDPVVRIVTVLPDSPAKVQVSFSDRETGNTDTIKMDAQIASREEPSAMGRAYLVVEGKHTFMLTSAVVSIGRDPGNMLVLSDMRVSRTHAQMRLVGEQYVIFDLQSTGGTMVNGRAVVKQALAAGDVISLAGVPLVFGQEMMDEKDATQQLPVAPDRAEKT
jgi:hypothetical protein